MPRSSILACLVLAGCAQATPTRATAPPSRSTPVIQPVTVPARSTSADRPQPAASDEIGATGAFDAATVVDTIRQDLATIQECYEAVLATTPTLQGKVVVGFRVLERGTVADTHVTENTTGSEEVAMCVVGRIRRYRFNPGPVGGDVNFSYPFVFAPQPH